MRISIVTPSFNQAPFLEETIRSVLRQDYPAVEYVIIDGKSSDGSVGIIRNYESRLAYWVSERDSGQVDAITKGFARATGDILAWVNSDDLLAPSAAKIAAEYFKADSSIGLVYGDRLHIDAKGNVIHANRGPQYYPTMLRHNITIPQETTFFRRAVYEKAGGLDAALHFSLDFDLWCRIAPLARIKHVPAFLGCYREHALSKSTILHGPADEEALKFQREQDLVFRRHFGTSMPGRFRMLWYRLLHHTRFLIEARRNPCRQERIALRRLMEQ